MKQRTPIKKLGFKTKGKENQKTNKEVLPPPPKLTGIQRKKREKQGSGENYQNTIMRTFSRIERHTFFQIEYSSEWLILIEILG